MHYREQVKQARTIMVLQLIIVALAVALVSRLSFDNGYDCAMQEMTHYEHVEGSTDELWEV